MKLLNLLKAQKRMLLLQREITNLREEIATLKTQNASMRDGMRRCVTCEYRINFKQGQDESLS